MDFPQSAQEILQGQSIQLVLVGIRFEIGHDDGSGHAVKDQLEGLVPHLYRWTAHEDILEGDHPIGNLEAEPRLQFLPLGCGVLRAHGEWHFFWEDTANFL